MNRLLLLLLSLSLFACQDRDAKVYQVPAELEPYIEQFVVEAAKRGRRLVVDDLIISYRHNIFTANAHAAGICRKRFGHTPIIHIDTTSPNWRASEMSREQLVFHELCHCLLDRRHRNDTLLNGNFASIMKSSGETLYGPRLTAFKRDYYLDELFHPATPAPGWAQLSETFETPLSFSDTVYFEDFGSALLLADTLPESSLKWDSLNYKDWPLADNSRTRRWVREGRFELQSYNSGSFFVPFNIDLDTLTHFQVDIELALVQNAGNMTFFWGGSDARDLHSIVISNKGSVSVGITGQGTMFTKTGLQLNSGDYNLLSIRRKDCCYYLFLNGRLIDHMRYEPLQGSLAGFGVSGEATELWVNQILVRGGPIGVAEQ